MSYQATSKPTSSDRKQLVPWAYVIIGVVVAIVLAILFGWLIVWLAANHADSIEVMRDLFMIGLALTTCVLGIVMMMLLVMVIRLVNMVEYEVKPILEKTNETVGTLRGTTAFVSKNVVEPVTTARGYASGLRRGMRILFRGSDRRGRR